MGFGILNCYDLRARQTEQRVITEDETGQPKTLVTVFDYDGSGNKVFQMSPMVRITECVYDEFKASTVRSVRHRASCVAWP